MSYRFRYSVISVFTQLLDNSENGIWGMLNMEIEVESLV